MKRWTIRTRLTVWHASVMIAVLVVTVFSMIWFFRNRLNCELNRMLHSDLEIFEDIVRFRKCGKAVCLDWEDKRNEEDQEGPLEETFLVVWSGDGELLFHNHLKQGRISSGWWDRPIPSMASGLTDLSLSDGTPLRGIYKVVNRCSRPYLLLAARSTERIHHTLVELVVIVLAIIPLAVLLSVVGGYTVVRKTLKPLEVMAERAARITASNLHERLPIENENDELGRLGAVFNEMMDRLERSFLSLRQFTSDASHEFRTPLTALRSIGEVALEKERTPEQYREIIGSMLEEVQRMTGLAESLLQLCRADEGKIELDMKPLDPAAVVRDTAEQVMVLVEAKEQRLEVEVPSSVPSVTADMTTLRMALLNLLDNAIKYSPPGGVIRYSLVVSDDSVAMRISDSGPGIGEEHRPYIFDRFYRVDPARSRKRGGAGLGLSIARWAVEANNGRLVLEKSDENGSTFVVVLPV